jgi:hypothetical protein
MQKKQMIALALFSLSSLAQASDLILYKCMTKGEIETKKTNRFGRVTQLSKENYNLCVFGESFLTLSSHSGLSSVQCVSRAGTYNYNYMQESTDLRDGTYEIKIGLSRDEDTAPKLLKTFIVNENETQTLEMTIPTELEMYKENRKTVTLTKIDLSCYMVKR